MGAHSHAEEDTRGSKLPADATAEDVKTVDDEGLAVFEEAGVRHEVLVKINQLALWVSTLFLFFLHRIRRIAESPFRWICREA